MGRSGRCARVTALHAAMAIGHYNRGASLEALGRLSDAAACHAEALRLARAFVGLDSEITARIEHALASVRARADGDASGAAASPVAAVSPAGYLHWGFAPTPLLKKRLRKARCRRSDGRGRLLWAPVQGSVPELLWFEGTIRVDGLVAPAAPPPPTEPWPAAPAQAPPAGPAPPPSGAPSVASAVACAPAAPPPPAPPPEMRRKTGRWAAGAERREEAQGKASAADAAKGSAGPSDPISRLLFGGADAAATATTKVAKEEAAAAAAAAEAADARGPSGTCQAPAADPAPVAAVAPSQTAAPAAAKEARRSSLTLRFESQRPPGLSTAAGRAALDGGKGTSPRDADHVTWPSSLWRRGSETARGGPARASCDQLPTATARRESVPDSSKAPACGPAAGVDAIWPVTRVGIGQKQLHFILTENPPSLVAPGRGAAPRALVRAAEEALERRPAGPPAERAAAPGPLPASLPAKEPHAPAAGRASAPRFEPRATRYHESVAAARRSDPGGPGGPGFLSAHLRADPPGHTSLAIDVPASVAAAAAAAAAGTKERSLPQGPAPRVRGAVQVGAAGGGSAPVGSKLVAGRARGAATERPR